MLILIQIWSSLMLILLSISAYREGNSGHKDLFAVLIIFLPMYLYLVGFFQG